MDEEDWLNHLDKLAKTAFMTAHVDIPCSDIDNYREIAEKCDVKLSIENVHITGENRKADMVSVVGHQDNITKFTEEAKCKRVRVFRVKAGW